MKPWNDPAAAWEDVSGEDFYFTFDSGEDGPYVVITPKEFFDQNGFCYDQDLQIDHIIPEYFYCFREGKYDWPVDVHVNKVRVYLKKRGFKENPALVKS